MSGENKKRTANSALALHPERKYQLFNKKSVQYFAESKGCILSEEVAKVLTEDLNYRIRELVSASCFHFSFNLLILMTLFAHHCLLILDID